MYPFANAMLGNSLLLMVSLLNALRNPFANAALGNSLLLMVSLLNALRNPLAKLKGLTLISAGVVILELEFDGLLSPILEGPSLPWQLLDHGLALKAQA